ncbi:hypothetical protein FS594_28975 (plasmid) [Rahnella aquatilis]|nr:hypothetical protein FS594_28975 [Rahnella aquatilis]
MSFIDIPESITWIKAIVLLCVTLSVFVPMTCIFLMRGNTAADKQPYCQDDAPRPEGNTSMLFKYPSAITGKALHAQMNADYFDAIYSAFLRSLQRAGYRLSDREPGAAPLLSGPTIDALAREVERARQAFLTVLGTDIEDDIDYQMQSGRAPKFLIQLIDSCERLGWKVVPVIKEPEDECASSFSVSP